MNEYDEQAEKFLKKTNTSFKSEFIKYDKYFPDDEDKRDIYQITLTRGERKYSFTFGNSINASGHYIYFSCKGRERIHLEKNEKGLLKLRWNGEMLNRGNSEKNENFKEPTAYDVISGLTKYDVGTFENFCSEFGYDIDSMMAHRIYCNVVKEYDNLKMLYSDEELEKMSEIQ